jgi:hypothetical protein
MKTKLLAVLLWAGTSLLAAPHVFVGVGIGGGYYPGYYAPPPPPLVAYAPPVYARPGYSWINGYWYPAGPRYAWRAGYWARPPYVGAVWVGPHYYGRRYYRGYWRR